MMFWGGHGLGLLGLAWMLGRGLLTLLFWGAVIVLIVLALRGRHGQPTPQAHTGNAPLDILNARYARGEITKAEYDQIRRDILQ